MRVSTGKILIITILTKIINTVPKGIPFGTVFTGDDFTIKIEKMQQIFINLFVFLCENLISSKKTVSLKRYTF